MWFQRTTEGNRGVRGLNLRRSKKRYILTIFPIIISNSEHGVHTFGSQRLYATLLHL